MLIHFHAVLLWLHFTVDEITHSMLCWKWDPRHSSPQSALNMWTTNNKKLLLENIFFIPLSLCWKLSVAFMAWFNKLKHSNHVNQKYHSYQNRRIYSPIDPVELTSEEVNDSLQIFLKTYSTHPLLTSSSSKFTSVEFFFFCMT